MNQNLSKYINDVRWEWDNKQYAINFDKKYNLILGKNGSGKTKIVDSIKKEVVNKIAKKEYAKLYLALVFIDESSIHSDKYRSNLINMIINDFEVSVEQINKETSDVAFNLFKHKYDFIKYKNDIYINFLDTGKYIVTDSRLDITTAAYQGATDIAIINLSLNQAIRNVLNINVPFILDSVFGVFDRESLKFTFKHLKKIDSQLIIFGSESEVDAINEFPTYVIKYRNDLL